MAEQIRLDPIGQGVEAEVGDPEQSAGGLEHMAGEDPKFNPQAQIGHREVSGRHDQRHNYLKPDLGQKANVFLLIGLFDEPDRLHDRPAGHIALHRGDR